VGNNKVYIFYFTSKNSDLIHSTSIKKTDEKSSSKSSHKTISQGSTYGKIYFLSLIDNLRNENKKREEELLNVIKQIVSSNNDNENSHLLEISDLEDSHKIHVSNLQKTIKDIQDCHVEEISNLQKTIYDLQKTMYDLRTHHSIEVSCLKTTHGEEISHLKKTISKIKNEKIKINSQLILMNLNKGGEKFESAESSQGSHNHSLNSNTNKSGNKTKQIFPIIRK
jgi:hypothetical protein